MAARLRRHAKQPRARSGSSADSTVWPYTDLKMNSSEVTGPTDHAEASSSAGRGTNTGAGAGAGAACAATSGAAPGVVSSARRSGGHRISRRLSPRKPRPKVVAVVEHQSHADVMYDNGSLSRAARSKARVAAQEVCCHCVCVCVCVRVRALMMIMLMILSTGAVGGC